MADERRRAVQDGYDAMADDYLTYVAATDGDPRDRFLSMLEQRLTPPARVVDLGCGAGVPTTAALARHHDVLGIDISAEQITRARINVPTARFERADLSTIKLPTGAFDAVTAFYSLTHLPRTEHPSILRRIATWLVPGGHLLATFSARGETDGMQDHFVGVRMYFSGYDPATNRAMLKDAGFEPLVDEIVAMHEPDGESSFQWVLAARPGSSASG